MISYAFGYGYGLRHLQGTAGSVTFGALRSLDGSPIASANGSVLTI